jgi:hypothetical protein
MYEYAERAGARIAYRASGSGTTSSGVISRGVGV